MKLSRVVATCCLTEWILENKGKGKVDIKSFYCTLQAASTAIANSLAPAPPSAQ